MVVKKQDMFDAVASKVTPVHCASNSRQHGPSNFSAFSIVKTMQALHGHISSDDSINMLSFAALMQNPCTQQHEGRMKPHDDAQSRTHLPEVGSSRKRTLGLATRAMPTLVRFSCKTQ